MPFQPGNKLGGRKKLAPAFQKILDANDVIALQTIVNIMKDETAGRKERLHAAELVIDRQYGKVAQSVTDNEGNTLAGVIMYLPERK